MFFSRFFFVKNCSVSRLIGKWAKKKEVLQVHCLVCGIEPPTLLIKATYLKPLGYSEVLQTGGLVNFMKRGERTLSCVLR